MHRGALPIPACADPARALPAVARPNGRRATLVLLAAVPLGLTPPRAGAQASPVSAALTDPQTRAAFDLVQAVLAELDRGDTSAALARFEPLPAGFSADMQARHLERRRFEFWKWDQRGPFKRHRVVHAERNMPRQLPNRPPPPDVFNFHFESDPVASTWKDGTPSTPARSTFVVRRQADGSLLVTGMELSG